LVCTHIKGANRIENVADWGLKQFQAHYEEDPLPQRGRARVGEATNTTPKNLFQPPPLPAELRDFVHNLRNNATDAERALWQILRGKQLGVKFRRQHPLKGYVLDFYCVERKLAVELDGGQHNSPEGRAHDAKRSMVLMEQGIRVIRFWNDEVFNNLDGVWQRIAEALGTAPPPRPFPPLGEGVMVRR
jgi:very-short-patch-repair endonuclease